MEASPAGGGYGFLMEPRALWSVSVTLGATLPALDGEGAYLCQELASSGAPASLRISLPLAQGCPAGRFTRVWGS